MIESRYWKEELTRIVKTIRPVQKPVRWSKRAHCIVERLDDWLFNRAPTYRAVTIEDESAEREQRFVTLGANTFGSLMVVVWTARDDDDVRIISVRKPTRKERETYEEGV